MIQIFYSLKAEDCVDAYASYGFNIPIGKPLDNVKLYIVDKNGKRLPPCACGELWAAGPQVGSGYLNQPEKTAEVFIRNPFEKGSY